MMDALQVLDWVMPAIGALILFSIARLTTRLDNIDGKISGEVKELYKHIEHKFTGLHSEHNKLLETIIKHITKD